MADDLAEVVPRQRIPASHDRIDGVVIGLLVGFDDGGYPLVAYPDNAWSSNARDAGTRARTVIGLGAEDRGRELALMFENGDPARPLILGRMHCPVYSPGGAPGRSGVIAETDGERLELRADREIVLRCGRASITLTRAGKILLRGAYLLSRSSGANRIKGGSVQIN
ncbi:DUF6484 domain-containing protein [Halomonas heilongjiangensis]|uniref:DUF6484 domain-containing protein n=1 Tax=Halomonas heilongjiangensis TaxID=1387883 RepID=A0A2N7TFP4_9GAMM|nr:DUF6484 domain-containing protein [Halomonas heilongjiangensis]PMR67006.1 hypothetical protein C1H66_21565 [Halomonas heilongjiangensis]PXX88078.1 hypothetical protein CR158_15410 [Halomonas heilongjiangensis]